MASNVVFGSLVPGGFFSNKPEDQSIPRSIRTNNPGALNVSSWQKHRPGFAGVTEPDGSAGHNVTTVYRTPEHGVASWYHLLSAIYGFAAVGQFTLDALAQRYAGAASGPVVDGYVRGWTHASGGKLHADTEIALASDAAMLVLARAMFRHEAGKPSPLHDDQIIFAMDRERAGTLPN